jgi:hypothetical protein
MADSLLIPFWIQPLSDGAFAPHGYGVTAFSLSDALQILREFGHKLPNDLSRFKITEGVRVSDLDQNHIVPNIGPIVVRGVWFPLQQIGI